VNSDDAVRDLLRRAQSGEGEALGELLDAYRAFLRGIAVAWLDSLVAARLDASDLVQQTCLSVHRQIGEFSGDHPAQFVAWLRQVHERNLRNVIRDQLHTQKRSPSREQSLDDLQLPGPEQPTPSVQAMHAEERSRLAAAIAQLPPDEQEALRLRYLEGCSLVETAERMQLTRDALLWLMKRALRRMRTLLPRDEH